MTKDQLITELNFVNHTIEKRWELANYFLQSPEDIALLVDVIFKVDEKISIKAVWVFEFVCRENLILLNPYLNVIAQHTKLVHFDSAVRPMAKIIEMIAENHYLDIKHSKQLHLKSDHKKSFIECCFDWMIRDEKVAVKAFAMNSLFLFGTEYSWIHPELRLILEKDFNKSSAAFKARAKHILKRLNMP